MVSGVASLIREQEVWLKINLMFRPHRLGDWQPSSVISHAI